MHFAPPAPEAFAEVPPAPEAFAEEHNALFDIVKIGEKAMKVLIK